MALTLQHLAYVVCLLYSSTCEFILNGRDFTHNVDLEHGVTGEKLQLKSYGRLANIITLDHTEGVKRVLCKGPNILVIVNHSSLASTWSPGDIVMGSGKWGCYLSPPPHSVAGIHRKIDSIKIPSEKKVELSTSVANFVDMFEHAKVFYRHEPGKMTNSSHHHQKRNVMADLLSSVNWSYNKILESSFNYNPSKKKADAGFKVKVDTGNDISFESSGNKLNFGWAGKPSEGKKPNLEKKVAAELNCASCFAYFRSSLTFKLEIVKDPKTKKGVLKNYLLQFDVEAEANYEMDFKVTGELSLNLTTLLWRGKPTISLKIPLLTFPVLFSFLSVNLDVSAKAALFFTAKLEANAEVSMAFGFNSSAKYTLTHSERGLVSTAKPLKFEPLSSSQKVSAALKGTLSIYPQFEIDVGISWGYGGIFKVALTAPLEISLKPELKLSADIGIDTNTGPLVRGDFNIKVGFKLDAAMKDPVSASIKILGMTYWEQVLGTSKYDVSITLIQNVTLLHIPYIFCMTTNKGTPCTISENLKYQKMKMRKQLESKIATLKEKVKQVTKKDLAVIGIADGGYTAVLRLLRATDTENNLLKKWTSCGKIFCSSKLRNDKTLAVKIPEGTTKKKGNTCTGYNIDAGDPTLCSTTDDVLRVYILPVGQGDATVIQCPTIGPNAGHITVIDLGSSNAETLGFWKASNIVRFLGNHIAKLRRVYITRSHDDHLNLLYPVLNAKKEMWRQIKSDVTLIIPEIFDDRVSDIFNQDKVVRIKPCLWNNCSKTYNPYICPGTSRAQIQILFSGRRTSNRYDRGLVLRLTYRGQGKDDVQSMLFPGDLSYETEDLSNSGKIASTVYKLAYQGAGFSHANHEPFLEAVSPSVVVTTGAPLYNPIYRHPSCVVLKRVKELLGKLGKRSYIDFSPQKTYSCGGSNFDEFHEMSVNGLPIFSSMPTETSLNLIQIDFKTGKIGVTSTTRDILKPNGKRIRRSSAVGKKKESPPQYVLREECETTKSPQNVNDVSLEDVCTPMETRITRDSDRFESLVQYTYGDVMFEDSERLDTWCGNPGGRCTDCLEISDDNWSSCADRMMAPKMVFLIRRLAALVYQTWPDDDSNTSGAGIQWLKVLEAWDEPTSSHPQGQHGNSSLHYEGRAAQLTMTHSNPTEIQELARLARCAGFDHVRQENDRIKVCVLPQEGDFGEIVSLLKAQLRVVKAPPVDEHQYAIPEELDGEPRIPKLFDGWNRSQTISEHFTIQDFLCPSGHQSYYRYFRLEEKLVECLEQVITDLKEEIIVVKGYSVRSVNLINIENRHPNEKHRHQMGQAVYIALSQGSKKTIKELAQQVVRSCLSLVTFDQLSLNIGIHSDGVYIDIHPSNTSQSGTPLYMWTGSGKRKQRDIDDMDAFAYQIQRGGPIIVPRRKERACKTPTFGEGMFYVSVQLDSGRPDCNSEQPSPFCQDTKSHREKELEALLKKVNAAMGSRALTEDNARDCFVNACGKCKGSGSVWEKKVRSCLAFLGDFISKASTPFRDMHNKVAFFNTENPNSTVHHLSCDQMVCLENTILHGILVDTVAATYRPEDNDIEKRLYSGAENPSPIMDLLEQVMAMRASGHVRVYIERDTDLSALHNVIKILLVHNSKVTNVTFHVTPDANKDYINEGLQRKIENWAGSACPTRSRVAISPFTVEDVPHHRVRRSLENSKARNDMKRDLHHWELNWLMRN